ncbi:MAG: DsbA family protein [Myxococcales bacterium]|nr:DsbA family protein [Myxococcales bacterium]
MRQQYPKDVRIVFKHMPLSFHSKAPAAHAAAEAALMQDKFWEMHDLIFENQRDLSTATFEKYAKQIGLDIEQYKKDLKSEALKKRIDDDTSQARKLGATGTPAFFINGRFLSGAQPIDSFKRLIDEMLKKG